MRCHCHFGAQTINEFIPQWEKALAQVFDVQDFPYKGFKPKEIENQTDSEILNQVWVIVERWKDRIKFSENYWKSQIIKYRAK
jgi:hypothetical protein